MARRKLETVKGVCGVAVIYRDAAWDEYIVAFNGGTYHTDEKQDARNHARHMVKGEVRTEYHATHRDIASWDANER